MNEKCPKSPNGDHCWHVERTSYYSWPSQSKTICCWCGMDESERHGGFLKWNTYQLPEVKVIKRVDMGDDVVVLDYKTTSKKEPLVDISHYDPLAEDPEVSYNANTH